MEDTTCSSMMDREESAVLGTNNLYTIQKHNMETNINFFFYVCLYVIGPIIEYLYV